MYRIVFAILAAVLVLGSGDLRAAELDGPGLTWPPLPTGSGFVAGRAATQADIDAGNALFLLGDGLTSNGAPLAIDVPQYALFNDEGITTVVVVVQAEQGQGGSQIGARKADGSPLIGLIGEFELLGTQPNTRRVAAKD